jgi:hypothetical protein
VVVAVIAALLVTCLSLPTAFSADHWVAINNATLKFNVPEQWTMASTPNGWQTLTSPTKDAVLVYTFFTQACESAVDLDQMVSALGITNIKWKRPPVNNGIGVRFPSQWVDGCDIWTAKLDMGQGTQMLWLYAAAASAPDSSKYQAMGTFRSLQLVQPYDQVQPPFLLPVDVELQRRLSTAPTLFNARVAETSDHWFTLDHPCVKLHLPTGWTTKVTSDRQWGAVISPNGDAVLAVTTIDSRQPGESMKRSGNVASALGVNDIKATGAPSLAAIGSSHLWAKTEEGTCRFQQPGDYISLTEVSPGPHPVAGATSPPSSAPIWVSGQENLLLIWIASADARTKRRAEMQAAIDSLQWR